jgi:hypothetical protein
MGFGTKKLEVGSQIAEVRAREIAPFVYFRGLTLSRLPPLIHCRNFPENIALGQGPTRCNASCLALSKGDVWSLFRFRFRIIEA